MVRLHRARRGGKILCKVVDDGFRWFDEGVVYHDAGFVRVDDAPFSQFLAVCFRLSKAS